MFSSYFFEVIICNFVSRVYKNQSENFIRHQNQITSDSSMSGLATFLVPLILASKFRYHTKTELG